MDDEGFTLVQRRRRTSNPAFEASAPDHRRYRLTAHQQETVYGAVRKLQEAQPDLRVRLTVEGEEIYLTPKDEASAFCLSRLAREGGGNGLHLEEVERRTRGVVMRYPLSYSLTPLQEHPRVTFARRCVKRVGHGRIEQTRQVEVTFRGPAPESLDLGLWGVFSCRRYVPEPLRCFKCQAFGHVQKHCKRESELCGVCSQRHRTSECISALRAGEHREACCPNCGGRHHVWARHCPERARRLPPSARKGAVREPRASQPPTQPESQPATSPAAPPAPAPATPGKKRKRRGKKRRKSTPSQQPATQEAATQTRKRTAEAATQKDIDATDDEGIVYRDHVVLTREFFAELLRRVCGLTIHGMSTEEWFVRPDMLVAKQLRPQDGQTVMSFRLPDIQELFQYEGVEDNDMAVFESLADVNVVS